MFAKTTDCLIIWPYKILERRNRHNTLENTILRMESEIAIVQCLSLVHCAASRLWEVIG